MRTFIRTSAACLAGMLLGLAKAASSDSPAEVVVSPPADGEPVLQRAIDRAAAGTTIRLQPGVYRETVIVTKPLALVGEKGAVIDPSKPLVAAWAPASEIGPGVYRASVRERPSTLFLDGKVIAAINEQRTEEAGAWNWQTLLAKGTPLSGYRFVKAIWVYRSAEKAVYLRTESGTDPKALSLSVVWDRGGAVAFRGADGASIRGVTIAHAYTAVSLIQKARHCVVSGCTLGPWDKLGVDLGSGATECLVEDNEIFRGALEDWTPLDDSKERYEVWQIHKRAGYYDRVGVDLVRAGAGNRIHRNHVYLTFDGIDVGDSDVESLDIPLRSPDDGRDTEIWDNVIEHTRDSGIELGAGCIDVRVHHNILRNTHGGLRYKLPRIGPVFIYRNVLVDGTPFNIWYSMDDSPAEGYVYHNTIVGGSVGLAYSSFQTPHQIGAPHWHYLNNLVITKGGFFQNWRTKAPTNFTADYNVVVGGHPPYPGDAARDSHSRYVTAVPLTQSDPPVPAADSPAIDAGLDLSTYYHGGPLPGCEPGYFKGKAPDAGAVEVR